MTISSSKSSPKILFFVTGSIAAFKAAQVVSSLVQDGCEVQCVMSESALRFVGESTFEGLTGKRVLTDLWEAGRAMDHIHLSRWADFGVVCPASANTLAHMALGLGEGIVSTALLAWPRGKDLFVFPAMNVEMWAAAPVQMHVASLRSRGICVADTGEGALACGESGSGRLMEPDEILRVLGFELNSNSAPVSKSPTTSAKPSVLITSGATRESIDGIRFITNHSTGRTGSELAEYFLASGWSVTYLHGQSAALPSWSNDKISSTSARESLKKIPFSSYQDLKDNLRSELGSDNYEAIIHCAAVSDYTVDEISHPDSLSSLHPDKLREHKIASGGDLVLHLAPTEKILPQLKEFSRNKAIQVVGFKLTLNSSASEMRAAAEKILDAHVDAVVANDWAQVAADRSRHPGVVLQRGVGALDGKELKEAPFQTVTELATKLVEVFENRSAIKSQETSL